MVAEDNLLVEKSGEGIVLSLGVNTDYSSVSPSEDLSGSTASSGRFKNSEVSKCHCALNQLYIFHPGGMAGGVVSYHVHLSTSVAISYHYLILISFCSA